MKNLTHSCRFAGLICALGTFLVIGACSSDEPASSGDGGVDGGGGKGTGGKATGGSAGKAGAGGSSAGASGAGGASGATGCTAAAMTECDGAEDCPTGKRCCGEYVMGVGYNKFGCYDTCGTGMGGMGGAPNPMAPLVFELCHAGDTCEDSTAMCLTSAYLPGSLSRCLPAQLMGMAMGGPPNTSLGKGAGEINCGTGVCGDGEECCVHEPGAPYCAPKGSACTCDSVPPEAGAPPVPEAGVPDASTPPPDATTPPADAAGD
jgi:hypothetical protein